ncbi:hypothetical protein PIB30_089887 [Stylosanthes scabra]|uniref:Putative plant transposon protein domain-containing protein n=1 Tax=Stylosanthes scabra TaxID=79078 RepID=A0ABU6XRX8_9FABA|nr:hypothetical protein [Stylosanthes scabra]
MPRAKQTPKRTRNEEVVYMEPPSDHPLLQYFSRLDDFNNYIFNFSERIVILPRYLDIQLLESQNFNQLSTILHDQGLINFVQIKNTWYPKLIRICYSTLSINFNEEHPTEFTMKFRLSKVDYELDSYRLASIWNLDRVNTNDACLFDGNKTPESWGPHVKRQAFDLFNIQRVPKKKIMCTVFNKEMRVLHYLINYVLMPRSTGHSHVTIDDLLTMWAMVNGIKIYWPYFIAHNMLRFTKSDHSKGLGYAYLWTRIFEYVGIDVSGESGRRISQNNIIDERTIHHMGRVLLRIEQNQANMDTHLTRVDQRLSRIEQYLEIDEDEDQD